MNKLSAAAIRSLKTIGAYKCKVQRNPYRVVITNRMALATYNKLYIRAFLNALNTGDCYRHEVSAKHPEGIVTTRQTSWVSGIPTSQDFRNGTGYLGKIMLVGYGQPVGYVVDSTYGQPQNALTEKDLDVMSDGMYGSEKQYTCMDSEYHDGEECTCHTVPHWNENEGCYSVA